MMSYRIKDASWIILHLGVTLSATISLLSGLRIAVINRPWLLQLDAILPQGLVHELHLRSAGGLFAAALAYTAMQLFRPKADSSRKPAILRWLGRFGLTVLSVSLVTGIVHYFSLINAPWVEAAHFYAAFALLLFVALHTFGYFIYYGHHTFGMILLPRSVKAGKLALVGVVAMTGFGGFYQLAVKQSQHTLEVPHIGNGNWLEIDGVADEKYWRRARPVRLHSFGAGNFDRGRTDIDVRALRNDYSMYFHIRWTDAYRSLSHLPLVKTEQGWKVTEDGFYRFDERRHYEDKLAVILSHSCEPGASATAHLGPKPLADKPANWHGKGYHYAADEAMNDLWHWKAVRTNAMNLADDNFIAVPDIVRAGSRRYTAGYRVDAKESGAYIMNWKWYRPNGVEPLMLPESFDRIKNFQPGETFGDETYAGIMPWDFAKLYQPEDDHYPVGTVLPSVLYYGNRFEGDRSHVRAFGRWNDGKWSLELERKLDTGSKQDLVLQDGLCLWVAAFDGAQIAHSRHNRPLRLTFRGGE